MGFAKACNQGIKLSRGEYILLLNSDTILLDNSLKKMAEYMDKDPKVGVATCKLVGQDKKVVDSGGFFPTIGSVFVWMFFIDELPFIERVVRPFHPLSFRSPAFESKRKIYERELKRDWVNGAFFLIRRKLIEEVGMLDENIFMYMEEVEYCYRVKMKGWQVGYNPLTEVIHLGGKSSTPRNALLAEYRGLKYFYQKHKPLWQQHLLRLSLKVGAILRIVLFGIIRGNKELRDIYVEAFSIA